MMKLKERWLKLERKWQIIVVAGLFTLLSMFVADFFHSESPTEVLSSPQSADTYIPAGFVLIPIDIENYQALDSVLGNFGVVDLFVSASVDRAVHKLVAKNLRILRAPLNPSNFAVLTPEAKAKEILQAKGPFYVAIKNPNAQETEFERESKAQRKIIFE